MEWIVNGKGMQTSCTVKKSIPNGEEHLGFFSLKTKKSSTQYKFTKENKQRKTSLKQIAPCFIDKFFFRCK